VTGRWFSTGTQVSSINKTDLHDITEILLKVALNTIKPNQTYNCLSFPQSYLLLKATEHIKSRVLNIFNTRNKCQNTLEERYLGNSHVFGSGIQVNLYCL
jgi:hypothetical protein